jgi:hypothetical protein|eukprot:2673128-Prymnesium_polylepis.2
MPKASLHVPAGQSLGAPLALGQKAPAKRGEAVSHKHPSMGGISLLLAHLEGTACTQSALPGLGRPLRRNCCKLRCLNGPCTTLVGTAEPKRCRWRNLMVRQGWVRRESKRRSTRNPSAATIRSIPVRLTRSTGAWVAFGGACEPCLGTHGARRAIHRRRTPGQAECTGWTRFGNAGCERAIKTSSALARAPWT